MLLKLLTDKEAQRIPRLDIWLARIQIQDFGTPVSKVIVLIHNLFLLGSHTWFLIVQKYFAKILGCTEDNKKYTKI